MSLSTPTALDRAPWEAPLAPVASRFARLRARARCEALARLLPRSVLFSHASRTVRGKRVALTFDDGPDAMTPLYLDVLDTLGVRATFFLIGENLAATGDLAAKYVARGHEVGGHGWSHQSFPSLSPCELVEEIEKTEALLPSPRLGPKLVRPPRGELSAGTLLRLAAAEYVTVLWSVDSDDRRTRDPRAIEQRLAPERVRPGDVVLLHEMRPWTLEALRGAVGALRAKGFDFVTVSELMKEDIHG
jgi:peptidoglycan/xylan/chitin deacetylase (PgdA/CDA1 family)